MVSGSVPDYLASNLNFIISDFGNHVDLRSPDLIFHIFSTRPTSFFFSFIPSVIVIVIIKWLRYLASQPVLQGTLAFNLRAHTRYRPLSVIQLCDPEPARYFYFFSSSTSLSHHNFHKPAPTALPVGTFPDTSSHRGSLLCCVNFFCCCTITQF